MPTGSGEIVEDGSRARWTRQATANQRQDELPLPAPPAIDNRNEDTALTSSIRSKPRTSTALTSDLLEPDGPMDVAPESLLRP